MPFLTLFRLLQKDARVAYSTSDLNLDKTNFSITIENQFMLITYYKCASIA